MSSDREYGLPGREEEMLSIGIDVGTSSLKLTVFDEQLKVRFSASEDYDFEQPQNGWADQDPALWEHALETVCRKLRETVSAEEIAAVGLTGQMHGLVMLDADGKVIRPAILWCDQRTQEECDRINATIGFKEMIQRTGNPALPGFTLGKLLWVREHEPEHWKRLNRIMVPKDYIRYLLSGLIVTDVSDAGGMQLLDVVGRCWDSELMKRLELPEGILPGLTESGEISARVSKEASERFGLPEGIPIIGGGGDNEIAAIGTGVIEDGDAFLTIGTSGVLFVHSRLPKRDPDGRIHTFPAAVRGEYHMMGVTQAAGLSLKWLRTTAFSEMSDGFYEKLAEEVAKIPAGSDRLVYLPYLMGERSPHPDADCRGVFFGLSARHTRWHMARAVMEGVAFSFRDCKAVMEEQGVVLKEITITGGGANSDIWCQIIADTLRVNVRRLEGESGTTLGGAILGFVAAGVIPDLKAAKQRMKTGRIFEPQEEAARRYDGYFELFVKLYQDLKDDFKQLNSIS